LFIKQLQPSWRPFVTFCNKLIFYVEELVTPHLIPQLCDHPPSAVHDCLLIYLHLPSISGGSSDLYSMKGREIDIVACSYVLWVFSKSSYLSKPRVLSVTCGNMQWRYSLGVSINVWWWKVRGFNRGCFGLFWGFKVHR
jgi:hypothetical protein